MGVNPDRESHFPAARIERWTRTAVAAVGLIVLLLVVLACGPWFLRAGTVENLTRLFAYVILGVTWNALAGYGGLVSIGQQCFFGLGAYAAVRLSGFGLNPYLAMFIGAIGIGVLSVPLSSVMLRLKEGQFAIGMWVVAELTVLLVILDPSVHGETGTSLTQIVIYAAPLRRALTYWVAFGAMTAILVAMFALLRSPVGASVQAIRDDEEAAGAVGVEVLDTKRIVFVLAAVGAAIAGAIWVAHIITFQPNSYFSVQWAAIMIFMALVGGIGTFEGGILGAIVFFLLETLLGATGVWYLIILGAVSLGFALFLPRGIWGTVEHRYGLNLLPVGYRVRVLAPPRKQRQRGP